MSSVMEIGERIMWEVPPIDWRISAQYNAERDANRAFVAETRALEATEPELTITRYRQAMARMYEYEKLIYSWHGDERILDRITLCGGPGCSDSFLRFLSGSPCFLFGRRWFWRGVEVYRFGDVAIVPVSIDRQGQSIAS
jgi:hypothetical protein